MSEEFTKHIWTVIIVCSTLLLMSVSGCNMHNDYRISQAIRSGADPLEVMVAFSYQRTTAEVLAIQNNTRP